VLAVKLDLSERRTMAKKRRKESGEGVCTAASGDLNHEAMALYEVAKREGIAPAAFPSWISGRINRL
jgi:hypothetical protein